MGRLLLAVLLAVLLVAPTQGGATLPAAPTKVCGIPAYIQAVLADRPTRPEGRRTVEAVSLRHGAEAAFLGAYAIDQHALCVCVCCGTT